MNRKVRRIKRHKSIRNYIRGTGEKPRLSVFRSGQHIYAQLIDDNKGLTLVSSSDLDIKKAGNKNERAYAVGQSIAEKASKKNIKKVIFDRGGFLYHGRIANLAKGAREKGLEF